MSKNYLMKKLAEIVEKLKAEGLTEKQAIRAGLDIMAEAVEIMKASK